MNLRLLRKSSLAIPLNPPLSDSTDAAENPTKATPSLSASALVCVVALMLLAAALTIPGLNAAPIWID